MNSAVISPRSAQEFADAADAAVPQLFGSTSHLAKIQITPDRELPPHVGAAYTVQDQGTMIWRESSAKNFEQFLDGSYRRMSDREQVQFLKELKIDLMMFFHEAVHSQGSPDREVFEDDFVNGVLNDGIRAFKEGITQVAA